MILLSSIVKAKLLSEMPRNVDYYKAKNESIGKERENNAINELNEKRELIISQAIKKSQHIDNEATKRANALIESAQKSSRKIMMDAEKKGYDQGYDQGLVDGAKASQQAAEQGLCEIQQLVELMKTEKMEAIERQEKDLILIAFEIAKKVMKQQVQIDENAIPKMLEEILHENEGSVKIYLSEYNKSLDFHIDKAISKKLRSISKNAKVVMVKEVDKIMVETEDGIVDMSLPVQLEQLETAIDDAF